MDRAIEPELLSNLIGSIYDCVLQPERWEAVLDDLRSALEFKNAVMTLQSLPSGDMLWNFVSGIEPTWLARLPEYTADVLDQWGGLDRIHSHPLEEPAILSQVNPRQAWIGNRYHLEWGQPQGIIDVLAIGLVRDYTMIGTVGLGRHVSAGEIGEHEIEAAKLLAPHFRRATKISKFIDLQAIAVGSLRSTLDALSTGVVVIDQRGRILHANVAAERMLSKGDPILSARGVLLTRDINSRGPLQVAVAGATNANHPDSRRGYSVPATWSSGAPCILYVLPMGETGLRISGVSSPMTAVFVALNENQAVPIEAIATLFDLTPAETRVYGEIIYGRQPKEIAAVLGVEITTVKTHLRRIFMKTGTRRQAELIQLANSLAPSF